MRFLHTSDWHLGRSFHGHSTLPHLREVLGAIPSQVREYSVDVVLVSGDIFDHAAPAAELYLVLAEAIRGIRSAGAEVVLISGNHDNAIRLGFQAEWAALGGVHVLTRPDAFRTPLELRDASGVVDIYGIPYLEPMLNRELYPGERLREHRELLGRVGREIDELRAKRGNRSVVLSHCFAVNVNDADEDRSKATENGADLVWDLTSGGLDLVQAAAFASHDYVALGHLHGRSELAPNIRYSGAPLHFSFGEAGRPRGCWLVDLSSEGLENVEWLALPVPRALTRIRGHIDELLVDPELISVESDWVEAVLTDPVRPLDAMRRLRDRFPHCARIEFDPESGETRERRSYASLVSERSDEEVVDEFLQHVRNGHGLDAAEREVLAEVLVESRVAVTENRSGGSR